MKHILGIYISGKLWRKVELDDFPDFLKKGTISVGRRETCDICIPQTTVSREHAHIRFDGKNVTITDNNSVNGISVNGRRKNEIVMTNGTQVQLVSSAQSENEVVIVYFEFDGNAPVEGKTGETAEKPPRRTKEKKSDGKVKKNGSVSVGRRLVAAMADWTVVMFMCAGFCGIFVLTVGFGGIIKLILVLGLISIIWLYFALSESGTNGTTFGKQLFSLKVEDKNGEHLSFKKASLRLAAKILSLFTLELPVFGKGRCLHDVIAGTRVVSANVAVAEKEDTDL